jgi:hypothetical protein
MSAISCATKAADREAEQVDPLNVDGVEEGDRVVGHGFDCVRRRTGRRPDADVVERDHASLRGEGVDQRGIPVVEVAAEVLEQDERHIAVTEVAVRVLDRVAGRDSLGRNVGVRDHRVRRAHGFLLCCCRNKTLVDRPVRSRRPSESVSGPDAM